MNDIVEQFEVTFNQIHQHLKELNGFPKNDNFVELLQRSKRKHSVIRVHFDQLKQYAKLRNAIVHERISGDYFIATPHEDVVKALKRIKRTLDQPPEALEFATRPVLFFKDDTELSHIIEAFQQHRVSQFPIYTNDRTFAGLLTNDGVVRWLSENHQNGTITLDKALASDVLSSERERSVEFLKASAPVFELEEQFEISLVQNRKLKAVILTDTGNPDDLPAGIVTTWDLIKVDQREREDEEDE
ncbi:CBS domain-containing protein [Halobacillus karajensis]|uniref:CBS domain-containing protein n=1 Tax=Halobacillus karajensis TaxID=195088 RepID=UPI0008A80ACB|nr:CBS domain-containing protein [Halobacillus karajensis]SEH45125.1 CBS domain-containing protein [Halobacillus karajensis]